MKALILMTTLLILGCSSTSSSTQDDLQTPSTSKSKVYSLDELMSVELQASNIADEELALRIEAIQQQAEQLGSANAYMETMDYLMKIVEKNADIVDGLLPFEHLANAAANLNVGEAKYVVPGMVDKVESHAAIDGSKENTIIRTDDIVYRLRAQPRPVLRKIHWSDYLYEENSIDQTEPVTDLLPTNSEELKAYQAALKEGWQMGKEQAIFEMRTRIIDAFSDAAAMVRYINLVESNYIEKPDLVIENVGVVINGDQMGLGTQLISLDGNAEWQSDSRLFTSPIIEDPRDSIRRQVLSDLETGELTPSDIEKLKVHH